MENEKKLKFNPDDMIAAADEQFPRMDEKRSLCGLQSGV